MVGDQAAQPVGRPPQDEPAACARVHHRVGRDLVHGQYEVVQPRPAQPGRRALACHQRPQPGEVGPAENDIQQVAVAGGDVLGSSSVKGDHSGLTGHVSHVSVISSTPLLRLAREMLQTVALSVRVSGSGGHHGDGDVTAAD
jgi:hypothetical protein